MDIIFDNIINARDLGGFTGHAGKRVRNGCLLRTAHLHDATDADIARLQNDYHLARIFDFRSLGEAEFLPDCEVPGATHHLLPTIDLSAERLTEQPIPQEAFLDLESHIVNYSFYPEVQAMAANMYPSLIRSEYSQLQYATFLRLIVETPEGAVLWHCFQGKDRTGWGAAFILSALGVAREDIIADFDLSNIAYTDIVNRLNAEVEKRGGGENEKEVIRAFMGVSTNNFRRTLDLIDREFGGIINYLQNQLMLTQEDIQLLRQRYLIP
ncbi:MAG: tyrosine-protein phosphatase [Paludibacteraceae bacterium]|nr:tyrosine-protein phosphatase [Paludibacteraceae bacterium]